MLGWKLFTRAATLLIENLSAALRVSLLPYGLATAVGAWLLVSHPGLTQGLALPGATPDTVGQNLDGAGLLFLGAVVNLVAWLWIAVDWHRFVLLSEDPEGWVPPLHGRAMLGYLGRSILIGLLTVLVILLVSTMAAVLVLPLFGPGGQVFVSAVAFFVAMILFYRLGLVLPARAVDRSMSFAEAMAATRGHSGTVVILALVTAAVTMLLQVPTLLDAPEAVPTDGEAVPEAGGLGITFVYQTVVQWIALMLGVGTLTTLYGHLVEGRPVE